MHIFADKIQTTMRLLLFIFTTTALFMAGCSGEAGKAGEAGKTAEARHSQQPDITMMADTAAYIEMLEQDITRKVLEKERNTRSMMLTIIILTIIVSSVVVDKIAIAKRKTEIRNKWLKRDIEKLEQEIKMLSEMKEEGVINEDMKMLLEERLNVLNGFITAHI